MRGEVDHSIFHTLYLSCDAFDVSSDHSHLVSPCELSAVPDFVLNVLDLLLVVIVVEVSRTELFDDFFGRNDILSLESVDVEEFDEESFVEIHFVPDFHSHESWELVCCGCV